MVQNVTQEYLNITQIIIEDKYQFRAALDPLVLENYATLIGEGTKFPNVICYRTPESLAQDQVILVDGFQRIKAYLINDYRKINCDVIEGSEEEALMYALNANMSHGAAYTNEDKRKRVRFAFGHAVMKKWSDNRIAKHLGLSQGFVSSQHKEYDAIRGIDDKSKVVEVATKDGRAFHMDTQKGTQTKAKNKTRNKPTIPEEQLVLEDVTVTVAESFDTNVIYDGESPETELEIAETSIGAIKFKLGQVYINAENSIWITFNNLDRLADIKEPFDLMLYSSSIPWIVDHQKSIFPDRNIIIQGHSGEDINRIQNIETLANTFNLFIVNSKIFVVAYWCSKNHTILDKVIDSYESYILDILLLYLENSGSTLLLVDPSEPVAAIVANLGFKCLVFYSKQNKEAFTTEINHLASAGIEVSLDNSDIEDT